MTLANIDHLKAQGKFFAAGELAAKLGIPCNYGCHFGMRSERQYAMNEFAKGYQAFKAQA